MMEKSVDLDGEGGVEGRMPPGGGLENPRLGLEGYWDRQERFPGR